MGKKILTDKEVEWIYKKWCEGYSYKEISEALYVSIGTIHNAVKGRKKEKPKLVYYEE